MGLNPNHPTILTIGNYCHDILFKDDVIIAQTLGGSIAFISNLFDSLRITSEYISKVGHDFIYQNMIKHKVTTLKTCKTMVFHAYFESGVQEMKSVDRILKRVKSCEGIFEKDLVNFSGCDFGMCVGVGGEVGYETLKKMLEICESVVCDVQSLIRVFDGEGRMELVNLGETRFLELVPKIAFLKASAEEAEFVDVEEVRKWCCVVVTSGEKGCTVYWKDGEVNVSPFKTVQVDPTGAGDSFLGGLMYGLVEGLSVVDASLLGNFFGSLTVEQIGLPVFDSKMMEKVKEVVHERKLHCKGHDGESRFMKPKDHEEFIESLTAAKLATRTISPDVTDQALDSNPGFTNHPMLFLKNGVLEEPVASTDVKP